MEKVSVTLEVPKESKEVVDFLDKVLEKVMSGASLDSYATLIAEVLPAIDGINKVLDEVKSDGRDEIAGYLVHKIMGRLLK